IFYILFHISIIPPGSSALQVSRGSEIPYYPVSLPGYHTPNKTCNHGVLFPSQGLPAFGGATGDQGGQASRKLSFFYLHTFQLLKGSGGILFKAYWQSYRILYFL